MPRKWEGSAHQPGRKGGSMRRKTGKTTRVGGRRKKKG